MCDPLVQTMLLTFPHYNTQGKDREQGRAKNTKHIFLYCFKQISCYQDTVYGIYSCHKLVRSFLAKKTTQWLQKNAILVYNLLLFWASCQSGHRLKLCILYFTPLSGYFDKKGNLTFLLTRKYFHRPKWPGNRKCVFLSVSLP